MPNPWDEQPSEHRGSAATFSPGAAAYLPGNVVTISGLQSRPELNGYKARVDGFDTEKGRYTVQVETGVGTEAITLALKAANLTSAGAPPPPPPPMATAESFAEPPPPPKTKNGLAAEEAPAPAAADEPWVACATPEGVPYWHNTSTGESTWTDPALPSSSADTEGLPEGWQAGWDPQSERVYYANPSTGETSWTKPGQPPDAAGASSPQQPAQQPAQQPSQQPSSGAEAGTPAGGGASARSVGLAAAESLRSLKAQLQASELPPPTLAASSRP